MKHLKLILAVIAILSFFSSKSQFEFQTCQIDIANLEKPWTWPGHNNWFIGKFSGASNVTGKMLDFQAGFTFSTTGAPVINQGTPSYEGVTTASNDLGELVVFTNGRWAWDKNSNRVSTDLQEGNEGGSSIVGSASQGVICVRHPLTPKKFYIITTGDVIGGANPPVSYNIFNENGAEIQGATSLGVNACEGIAATFHENKLDIWVTVLGYNSTTLYSFLLTCDGFVDPPVETNLGYNQTLDAGRGGIAFSHDGQNFAAAFPNAYPNADRQLVLYDFDNLTGTFSNRTNLGPTTASIGPYDVMFSKDNSEVFITGGNAGGVHSINLSTGAHTKKTGFNELNLHHSCEIGGDGNYYFNGKDGLWRWSGSGSFTKVDNLDAQGLPTMYIPPAEEPDIQEVGPFCDTVNVILPDLHTNWICNGLSAEDTIGGKPIGEQRHRYFILDSLDETQENLRSSIIIDEKTGVFNPKEAGPGFHKVVFEFCDVNDTIEIEVRFCPACRAETQDITPKFCAGNDYLLDTLVTDASRQGVWTIDSFPSSSGKDAEIQDGISDTLFDATDLTTKWGTYKVLFSVTDAGETCYDSVYIVVDSIPDPILTGDTICEGDGPVTFDPGTFHTYEWGPDGETSPTITKNATATISVEVTTSEGCIWSDSVEFLVNPLPEPYIESDTICDGDTLIIFDAGDYFEYDWSTGETTQTIEPTLSGDYTIEVTDTNGCKEDTSFNYTIHPKPVVDLGTDQVICADDPAVTFDAGNPGVNYNWSNGETSQQITTKIDDEYTVIIVDANTCSDTDTVVLTVNAMPIVDLGPDSAICQIEPDVVFDAGNVTAGYVWSNGENSQTISTKIEDEYSVIVTDTNGCIGYDTVFLTVYPMPTVNMADDEICIGDAPVTFDVGAVFDTYDWNNTGAGTSQTFTTDVDGEHTVIFTDANGCVGHDTVILTVHPLPTPDLGNDSIICDADPDVIFDAGSYDEYSWSSGETSQTISKHESGTFEVEVTDANGCKQTDEVVLLVIEMPTPDVIGDYTKCPGANHTFDVGPYDNGNGPYTYAWQDGSTGSTYATTAAENVWVDITDNYGCTGRDLGAVTDNPNLTVDITASPDVHLCEGESALLVPNYKSVNGYFFQWSGQGSGTSETVTATQSGIYNLHVDNGGGCEGDGSIEIFVHPNPVVTPGTAAVCDGLPASIGDNQGNDYNYLWNNGETTGTISVFTGGTYTQTLTHTTTGCIGSGDFDVTIHSNPTPDLGDDIKVCTGVPVTLQDNSGQTVASHAWSSGETTPLINPTSDGTYSLTVTTAEGCTGNDDVLVEFIPIPTVDLGPDINMCEGESAIVDAGNANLDISWNSGQTTSTISVNQTYSHIVTVSDLGCETKDTIDINVVPLPTSSLNQSLASEPICFEEDDRGVTLLAGTNPAYSYLWSTQETTASINIYQEGTYFVQISVGNCSIEDNIQFKAYCPSTIYVPNAFTPDQDGKNDSFNAKGYNLEDYEMYIYNRWGQLIFKSESLNDGWDGTYLNNDCQIDVYVWKIYYSVESTDGSGHRIKEQKSGRVSLIR
tara:strand:+ start:1048 stop:5694 length:4647 start_codon:yes stop_codon:yes gene_type:complete